MKYTFDLKKNYQEGHSNRRRQSRVAWRNDPGKPAQNGRVERSHRTDQEMFYDRRKFKTVLGLKLAIRKWNEDYNNLEHCALDGLTPNETLARVQNVCA